jgi:hypothetical protein
MVSLLLIKTSSLLDAANHVNVDSLVHIAAVLSTAAGTESDVFSTHVHQAGFLDRLFLSQLADRVDIRSASQPMTLVFERQLRLGDVLTEKMLQRRIGRNAAPFRYRKTKLLSLRDGRKRRRSQGFSPTLQRMPATDRGHAE